MSNNNYRYSYHWFVGSDIHRLLHQYIDKMSKNTILEIGSFEGLSSVFFADNFLDNEKSSLTCVDPFLTIEDNDHQEYIHRCNAEKNFDYNITHCKNTNKIKVHKIISDDFFKQNTNTYNFIYIDGCHFPEQITKDMENAFNILEPNGIMWMDDYRGGSGDIKTIKIAMDLFLEKYNGKYVLLHSGYQLAIRKL